MHVKLGCIGCGNMGGAILRGLARRGDMELYGLDADANKIQDLTEETGMKPVESVKELVENTDYILVAVKPNQVHGLLEEMASRLQPSQVIISIAAGLTLESLKKWSSGVCPVIRIMPNTPAMVQSGLFALCFDDPMLGAQARENVEDMFASLGQVHVLEERYFDAFTSVAGSGPAYVYYVMEAVVEAAVSVGLSRPMAREIAIGLFSGSVKLAEDSGMHLGELREMVTSPAGTTIAATNHLDRTAVRGHIIDAVRAACKRSKELG